MPQLRGLLQEQEKCIRAVGKQNQGGHLQAVEEIHLLHPVAKLVQQI